MTGTDISSGQASLPTPNPTKSFWHRNPSKVLLGHRTTPSLPTEADLVIIGSGISGVCAAHFLRENDRGKDLTIVMLEAREACWGATGRNGGHCQPLLYTRSPEIGAFELRNYQTIKALVDKHNIPCEWKSVTGVHAYMDEDMFAEGLDDIKALQKADPELAKLVQVVTKDSKSPSLEGLRVPDAAGALIQAYAASLSPYKLVCWLLENLLSSSSNKVSGPSFNLQTSTPATHLQKVDNGSWIVHTPRGMIVSKHVLLTTNAYTSHLLPKFSDLIVPVRGEMSSLLPPRSMRPATNNAPLTHSYVFIGHGEQNINQDDYLIQRPFTTSSKEVGGELMFGGGRSYAKNAGLGVSDDSSIDDPAAAYLRQELNVVLDLQNKDHELEASYEWSGIMGYSRDNRPWVGEVSEELGLGGGEGLWICAGFTAHGMPNTCLSAKAVVEIMMGKKEEHVDLPDVYKLTVARLEKARMCQEVHVADAMGVIGFSENSYQKLPVTKSWNLRLSQNFPTTSSR